MGTDRLGVSRAKIHRYRFEFLGRTLGQLTEKRIQGLRELYSKAP
jgi:hypothetical protein